MRVRVIAVGTRMPAWVRSACDDYLSRLRSALPVTLTEIEPAARRGADVRRAVATEGERMLAVLGDAVHAVVLDERGKELSTREFSGWLATRMGAGEDLAFLIGGADGHAPQVLRRGQFTLALSRLTLPHALARVVLAEQLYRAHSLLANHPYHRA